MSLSGQHPQQHCSYVQQPERFGKHDVPQQQHLYSMAPQQVRITRTITIVTTDAPTVGACMSKNEYSFPFSCSTTTGGSVAGG